MTPWARTAQGTQQGPALTWDGRGKLGWDHWRWHGSSGLIVRSSDHQSKLLMVLKNGWYMVMNHGWWWWYILARLVDTDYWWWFMIPSGKTSNLRSNREVFRLIVMIHDHRITKSHHSDSHSNRDDDDCVTVMITMVRVTVFIMFIAEWSLVNSHVEWLFCSS